MMPRKRDLTGEQFGRLTATCFLYTDRNSKSVWECLCSCGTIKPVAIGDLTSGRTRSCGCLCKETRTKHGMHTTPEYYTWVNMLQRCCNSSHALYHYYGGRGITVCDAWRVFESFYRDMGDRPSDKYSLDRIDNNGNYCKDNCRWVTRKEQANNTRGNHLLSHGGKTLTVAQWAECVGLPSHTIRHRISSGWSVEDALTVPRKQGKDADVDC